MHIFVPLAALCLQLLCLFLLNQWSCRLIGDSVQLQNSSTFKYPQTPGAGGVGLHFNSWTLTHPGCVYTYVRHFSSPFRQALHVRQARWPQHRLYHAEDPSLFFLCVWAPPSLQCVSIIFLTIPHHCRCPPCSQLLDSPHPSSVLFELCLFLSKLFQVPSALSWDRGAVPPHSITLWSAH